MPPRLCPRCQTMLPQEQEGPLIFCFNCGAPQVTVSEELLLESQKQRAALDSGLAAGILGGSQQNTIVWYAAVRYAALAGAIAAALALISFALPPVIVLAWFWAIGAPVVVLGIYNSKFHPTRLEAGFGARLGLLCGLAIFFSMCAINACELVVARYLLHASTQVDTQLGAMFTQLRTAAGQQGGPAQASVIAWLSSPEARISLILIMTGFVLMLYLGLSAIGGAFAAVLRSRSEARR